MSVIFLQIRRERLSRRSSENSESTSERLLRCPGDSSHAEGSPQTLRDSLIFSVHILMLGMVHVNRVQLLVNVIPASDGEVQLKWMTANNNHPFTTGQTWRDAEMGNFEIILIITRL